MKKYNLLIIFIFNYSAIYSQCCEYIADPSFEDVYTYSTRITLNQSGHTDSWITKIDTTPMWGIATKNHIALNIKQSSGYYFFSDLNQAFDGKIFAKIGLLDALDKTRQRNLFPNRTIFLKEKLIKDSLYHISFYLKPFYLNIHSHKIEITLGLFQDSSSYITFKKDNNVHHVKNFDRNDVSYNALIFANLPIETFTKFELEYFAKGGEEYITIGNIRGFIPDKLKKIHPIGYNFGVGATKFFSYYALDLLSITGTCATNNVSKNLFVKTDTFTLLYDINNIVPINLNDLTNISFNIREIKIYSQTDSIGSENYNFSLSEKRSDYIKNFLLSKLGFDVPITNLYFGERQNDFLPKNRRITKIVAYY